MVIPAPILVHSNRLSHKESVCIISFETMKVLSWFISVLLSFCMVSSRPQTAILPLPFLQSISVSLEPTESLLERIIEHFGGTSSLLREYLYQEGPYTVFLPLSLVEDDFFLYVLRLLSTKRYSMHLYSLLSYHVAHQDLAYHIPVRVDDDEIMTMLSGGSVGITQNNSTSIWLHDCFEKDDSFLYTVPARVIDQHAYLQSDGKTLVYLTDRLLLPDWMTVNVLDYAMDTNGMFGSLIIMAGLEEELELLDEYTLLVPTNELPTSFVSALMDYPQALKEFVRYHIVAEVIALRTISSNQSESFMTLQGEDVVFGNPPEDVDGVRKGVSVNGRASVLGFQLTRYGVVYRLAGSLLIPPSWFGSNEDTP